MRHLEWKRRLGLEAVRKAEVGLAVGLVEKAGIWAEIGVEVEDRLGAWSRLERDHRGS